MSIQRENDNHQFSSRARRRSGSRANASSQ
jgi:hypothetical protein